jgi:hypothetical protein
VLGELLGRLPDQPRERDECRGGDDERGDVAGVEGVVEDERDRRQRERRPEDAFRDADRGRLARVRRAAELDHLRAGLDRVLDPVEPLVQPAPLRGEEVDEER